MQINNENSRLLSSIEKIITRLIPVHNVKSTNNTDDILLAVYGGDCVIFIDGMEETLIVNTSEPKGRNVGEPAIEVAAIGPQEGFVENIIINIGLLRKRIKTAKFKTENIIKGRVTKSILVISYIEGIVNKNLITELKERLYRIDTDGLIDIGHLRRFISDNKFTPFPGEIKTERPGSLCKSPS